MGDIPADMDTTAEIMVGTSTQNTIEVGFDQDWFRVELTAGVEVTITLSGTGDNPLFDPTLDLYDEDGMLLKWNYDIEAGVNLDAQITFIPTVSGIYYIDAYGTGPDDTGDYDLTVHAIKRDPLDSIDWGTKVGTASGTTTIKIYFAEAGEFVMWDYGIRYDSEGWKAYEIKQFMKALGTIEAVADIDFVRVNTEGQADFVVGANNDWQMEPGLLGFFNPPDTGAYSGRGMFNVQEWDWFPGGSLEAGGFGFSVIVHEVLHGLGLAHPHDRGGTSTLMSGVDSTYDDFGDYLLNQGVFTAMTYNEGFRRGPTGTRTDSDRYGLEVGPMALDIAVLQEKYGANTRNNGGDSTYHLPDANKSGTFYTTIWDTGGTDLILYDGNRNVTIDLRPATLEYENGGGGFISAAKGIMGGYTIANGADIENATSGQGNDTVIGNDIDNVLTTGAGNDTVQGRGGDDVIRSGTGNDRVGGWGGDDRIVTLGGNDRINGGNGHDTILAGAGDDRIEGGGRDDKIKADNGNDTVQAGPGNDRVLGGSGRDVIAGGAGNDFIDGGDDNDRITGQWGDDRVTLGKGADRFIFGVGHGDDTITDFNPQQDKLLIDSDLVSGRDRYDVVMGDATRGGGGITLNFDTGESIFLDGVRSFAAVEDAIVFI